MFSKILIANRGEIACRVIDTAREIATAAPQAVRASYMATTPTRAASAQSATGSFQARPTQPVPMSSRTLVATSPRKAVE